MFHRVLITPLPLREKCRYSEFFWCECEKVRTKKLQIRILFKQSPRLKIHERVSRFTEDDKNVTHDRIVELR